MPIAIFALGLVISFMFGGGIGQAHQDSPGTAAEAVDGAHDDDNLLDALTRLLLDNRLDGQLRLRAAALRQQQLAELIKQDPGAVLKRALSGASRTALAPELQALVEHEEVHDGTLQVLHADGPGGGSYLYNLRKASGEWLALHFAQERPELLTGSRVQVRGLKVQQALALGSGSALTVLAAPALSGAFGNHRVLVVLLNFVNQPNANPATPAQVSPIMFGTGASVTNFYREASYQQAWLTGDVIGPLVIPTLSSGCDYNLIASLARAAATAAGVALGQYSHLVYAFPSSGCTWWGLGTIGGGPGQAWVNGSIQPLVLAHELGHNFGLYHSHSLNCGSVAFGPSCTSIDYGDLFDTMGRSSSPGHFNAVQKELLGWLGYGASPPITEVLTSGTYTLDPIESGGSGPKALKVRTSVGDWFYVEYRKAIGFDANVVGGNANVAAGVIVHYSTGQSDGIYLLDMTPTNASLLDPALTVGKSFVDTTGGVTISPVWVDGVTAGVSVTVGSACVRKPPTVTVSPAQQTGDAGTTLAYTLTVKNNDTGCGTSSMSQQVTVPPGWTATLGAASFALTQGGIGSTALQVTSPASASPGRYAVSAAAFDSGTSASASAAYVATAPAGGGGGGGGTGGGGTGGGAPGGAPGSFGDNFGRPDSATLDNGWTMVSGALSVVSGEARNPTTRRLHMAVQSGLTGAIQSAGASFASTDNNTAPVFGVALRYQGPGSYYRCYRAVGGTSAVRISRVVNGAETVLKAVTLANPAKGAFFALSCQASGPSLTLKVNGVTKVAVTDSTFASGSVGFLMGYSTASGGAVSHRADNFTASVQ